MARVKNLQKPPKFVNRHIIKLRNISIKVPGKASEIFPPPDEYKALSGWSP